MNQTVDRGALCRGVMFIVFCFVVIFCLMVFLFVKLSTLSNFKCLIVRIVTTAKKTSTYSFLQMMRHTDHNTSHSEIFIEHLLYTQHCGRGREDTEQYRTCSCPPEAYSLGGGGRKQSRPGCYRSLRCLRSDPLGASVPPGTQRSVPGKTIAHKTGPH